MMTIFKILLFCTIASIAFSLIIGPIMRWGLDYEPPELPPLPSGSIDRIVP